MEIYDGFGVNTTNSFNTPPNRKGMTMFSIFFRIPNTGATMEVQVGNLIQAQETWDLLSKNFQMVNTKP